MSNDFHGLPTRSLGNDHLTLDYLAEAGPRIVRLFLAGSQTNLLAEAPDLSWDTPSRHLSAARRPSLVARAGGLSPNLPA